MKVIKCRTCKKVMEKKEDIVCLERFGECWGCQDGRATLDDFHQQEMEKDAKEKGYASYKDYAESEGQWK